MKRSCEQYQTTKYAADVSEKHILPHRSTSVHNPGAFVRDHDAPADVQDTRPAVTHHPAWADLSIAAQNMKALILSTQIPPQPFFGGFQNGLGSCSRLLGNDEGRVLLAICRKSSRMTASAGH